MNSQLEVSRVDRLKCLEAEIEVDIQAFVRVGRALQEIKQDELWREAECNSFSEYIDKKWQPRLTRTYATRLIKAQALVRELGMMPIGIIPMLTSEGLIRPLERFAAVSKDGSVRVDMPKVKDAIRRALGLAKRDGRPLSDHYIEAAANEITKGTIHADMPKAEKWTGTWKIDDVFVADVTSEEWFASMPESRVDFIVTDPPWRPDEDDGAYSLYEALGRLALKVLKPGGVCAVYMGKLDLPVVLQVMMAHLDYEWTMAVYQPDGSHIFRKTQFKEAWRPIGIFRKPGLRFETVYAPDAMSCTRDKSFHEWQQGIEPVQTLIEKYTAKEHLVLDPFVGGGTGPMAAKLLGRHYLAFDNDEGTVALARERIGR